LHRLAYARTNDLHAARDPIIRTALATPDKNEAARDREPWHALPVDDVLSRLETAASGLSHEEARRRLEHYGENRLELAKPESVWRMLLDQVRSVVTVLLVVAAALAWWLGDPIEAAAIAVVLLINVAIGFFTELRARRAMEALRSLEVPHATVVRDGRRENISARLLVPGDVIELEPGQSVPADARLIESTELQTTEAPLTGESVPTSKDARASIDVDAPLADRSTMVFQATAVVRGTGRAVVVATGRSTEVGKIGALTSGLGEERTPLEQRLDALGRRLVVLALAVAAIVGLVGLLRGEHLSFVAQTAIALAIAAVPEGLPAVSTITLALGVWRMARRKALVRRLPAVETLGSATIICTDKTGTLTAGVMRVTTLVTASETLEVEPERSERKAAIVAADEPKDPAKPPIAEAMRVAALANRADVVMRDDGRQNIIGDPTEAALLVMAHAAGVDRDELLRQMPEVGNVPFSSERQWMATFHEVDGKRVAFIKGAPGVLVAKATHELTEDGERELDDAGRQRWLEKNRELARNALRVLALGTAAAEDVSEEGLENITIVALAGMADPPADEVPETIAMLHEAGIRTVMITGDQQLTALSIARQLGMTHDGEAINGRELASMPPDELDRRLDKVAVFNRVSPTDKLRIVEALQRRGHIVAMLGDGVNDAAALKRADIGVAMGIRGTDIAKDSSDVVLADDRFRTVGIAVEEGRVIFDNIRKFVFYLFSCNVAEVLVLLIAGIVGLPQPLLPLHILWLNVVTDTFPALSLAVEPAEHETMKRPPRDPQEAILSRSFLGWITGYAALITIASLAAYVLALETGTPERARTVAFMTLALAQTFHLGNARSGRFTADLRQFATNRWALGAVALVMGLQLAALYFPFLANVLHLEPIPLSSWALIVPFSLLPVAAGLLLGVMQRTRVSDSPRRKSDQP
jgi:Ca2+-transporting ATPase